MPINREAALNVVKQLAEDENLQVTVKESGKGACIVGMSALVGGLVGGPIGLAIGGTIGSVYVGYTGKGKYKSVIRVLKEDMTEAQKDKLAINIKRALKNVGIEDIIKLTALLAGNSSLKELLIKESLLFFKNELGLALMPAA